MKKKDPFGDILVLMEFLALFVFIYVLAFVEIPKENKDLFNMLLGAWIVSFAAVIQYRVGSSKSSAIKDETINTQANAQANTQKDETINELKK